jgi:hypothetical protein
MTENSHCARHCSVAAELPVAATGFHAASPCAPLAGARRNSSANASGNSRAMVWIAFHPVRCKNHKYGTCVWSSVRLVLVSLPLHRLRARPPLNHRPLPRHRPTSRLAILYPCLNFAAMTSLEFMSMVMVHPEVPLNSNGAGLGPRR